ncbi:MAG TPA: hypothetical protein VD998_00165 [Verrucomicrobiae bacterium]|nr:hypothetical protein [Verrucomicrobiae bacterium]
MHLTSAKTKNLSNLSKAILKTLSFFHIYRLPITAQKIWQLLYKYEATLSEVERELEELVVRKLVCKNEHLYSIKHFDTWTYLINREEIAQRWDRVKKYYWLLSSIPFIEHVSVINSMAMGNADSESDIDFFVITKPNRLYFVRTMVIILFKLFGVYKTRKKINKQFCFGFYITSDHMSLQDLLLPGEDPYMVFWLGTIVPILGVQTYEKFIRDNFWIYSFLPNFRPMQRLGQIRKYRQASVIKNLLHSLLNIPAAVLEPFLRRIHINHTFKLPENHWKTSSTIANSKMLKLHALDPRKDLRKAWQDILQSLG